MNAERPCTFLTRNLVIGEHQHEMTCKYRQAKVVDCTNVDEPCTYIGEEKVGTSTPISRMSKIYFNKLGGWAMFSQA
jgi:hypothetical protein